MKILLCTTSLLLGLSLAGFAEEKNGMMATVSKKTLDRNDGAVGYYTRVDRTQGLVLDARNTSIRDFPEGEVTWTMVVRKTYEGGLEKYSGKEKLKPLRSSQQTQVVLGAAQIGGYKTDYKNYKDKIEYDVIITHNGKETLHLCSTPSFAALAKVAVSMDRPAEREVPAATKRAEGDDAQIAGDGIGVATNGRNREMPMPPKGTAPGTPEKVAPPAKPAENGKPAETPEAPPLEPQKPFDFFNLEKKNKPTETK